MRESVMPRSSRKSASSSTTSTWFLLIARRLSYFAQHPEMTAHVGVDVIELRAVHFAHFARDVEAQSRAGRGRREKRLEQLIAQRRRHSGPVVDEVQFYDTVPRV